MIQIAICDDNLIHMNHLAKLIRDVCAKRIPEKYDCHAYEGFCSAEAVVSYLKNHMINILFLDIEMKGTSGFELASILSNVFPDIIIIFVSAYENYVYSAFEYAPFRFLRKTHLEEELEPALLAAVTNLMAKKKRMTLDTVDGKVEVRLAEIAYFESSKNYLIAHLIGGCTYKFRGTVESIAEQLQNDDFYRIHQGYVINLERIDRLSGSSGVVMCDGVNLPISSRRFASFKKTYISFTGRRFSK